MFFQQVLARWIGHVITCTLLVGTALGTVLALPAYSQVFFLKDQTNQLKPDDLLTQEVSHRFLPLQSQDRITGLPSGTLWLRVEADNDTSTDRQEVISLDAALIPSIQLLGPNTVTIRAGNEVPWDLLPIRDYSPAFAVTLAAHSHWTGFLRIQGEVIPQARLRIEPLDVFKNRTENRRTFIEIYFGFLFALCFVNLLIYLFDRERSYLEYLLFQGALMAVSLLDTGFGGSHLPLLRQFGQQAFPFALAGVLVSSTVFAGNYLQLRQSFPVARKLMHGLLWAQIPLLALCFAGWSSAVLKVQIICLALNTSLFLASGILTWRRGLRSSWVFLLADGAILLGVSPWLATALHLLPRTPASVYGPMIGSGVEMLLFLLAVFRRMKQMKHDLLVTQNQVKSNLQAEIQHRKEMEHQIERQRAAALHASKMFTLGEMAGGIAHEINNPLAIIRLLSVRIRELLKADIPDRPMINHCLEQTDRSVVRISQIIRSLLSFAKSDEQAPTTQKPVAEILEQTLQLCREDFSRRGIRFIVEPVASNLTAECREAQIRQALLNLLSNAADAVSLNPNSHRWIRLSVREERGGVAFAVIDSGPGVPLEIRERILEPFFTTKRVGEGSGLGLCVAKGIAEAHRGALELDLTSPATCFELWIPKTQSVRVMLA